MQIPKHVMGLAHHILGDYLMKASFREEVKKSPEPLNTMIRVHHNYSHGSHRTDYRQLVMDIVFRGNDDDRAELIAAIETVSQNVDA